MEVLNSLFLILLSLIPIFLYFGLHKLIKPRNVVDNLRLPPGNVGMPFIGESLAYYLKIRKGLQFEFIKERMEKYSPKIFKTNLLGQPVAVLCNAEGNKFVFSNEEKLVKAWLPKIIDHIFPKSDNQPNVESTKMLRATILPFFLKANAVCNHVGVMDSVMKQHLETFWISKSEVKVVEMAKRYTLALAYSFFVGVVELGEIEEIVQGMDDIEAAVLQVRVNLPWRTSNGGIIASDIMRSKLEAIIRRRKLNLTSSSNPKKDFIFRMLSHVDENGKFFTVEDIASHLAGLIFGAYGSVYSTITMIMKSLGDNPSAYKAVLKEQLEIASSKEQESGLTWEDFRKMKYSWNVVCEVLRLYTPGSGFREAITDFTYEGFSIPKGWKLHWAAQGTHKNPEYFPNPEKFDPTRFQGDGPAPYTYIPFGGGLRMCPGNEFAKVEILTFIHYVVTSFKWEQINPDEKLSYFPLTRPVEGLPIRLYPRNACMNYPHQN